MKRVACIVLIVSFVYLAWAGSVQAGKSGIWKPADGSNNFYVQTYSTGSCLVIVTPDGQDFYVFLDPECDDEVVALEYFGRLATVDLKFVSDDTATADLVVQSKGTQYALGRVFEADCRNGDGISGTLSNSLGMKFAYIPPGRFTMGSPESELGRIPGETQHLVTITQGFYMQTTEVTQGQWKAVMGSNPSSFAGCGDDCPVENVSWEDVQAFIAQLNALGDGTYRLPTEAEWEYAARAGSALGFSSGAITETECVLDPNLDLMGWYCYNSADTTHPVAQKDANAWGLYDMHGNVYECCQDWYEAYPAGSVTDPAGPSAGIYRVIRGGALYGVPGTCRSADRHFAVPSFRHNSIGARLVRVGP